MTVITSSLRAAKSLAGAITVLSAFLLPCAQAQGPYDPPTNQTFEDVTKGMQAIRWYSFGTGSGHNITNLTQLASVFNPYGIAGTTVIHQEWERYQPFNTTNFVFGTDSLNLVATTAGGGIYPGGIKSGQIWTKETYRAGKQYNVYAVMVRMKVPKGPGIWPAMWMYSNQNGNGSEIDGVEFLTMNTQNNFDWTSFDHGPNVGNDIYSIMTNQWVWHPGLDFSAGYHDYEFVWTPDATYKYFDGQLIFAQNFWWTAQGDAQLGINLAVGSNAPGLEGLTPTAATGFPSSLQVQYVCIYAK